MLRLAEFGLFLLPFVLYFGWLLAGRRLPRAAVWVAAVLFLALAAGTLWFGLSRGLDKTERYVPAHVVGGRIVEGHGTSR